MPRKETNKNGAAKLASRSEAASMISMRTEFLTGTGHHHIMVTSTFPADPGRE